MIGLRIEVVADLDRVRVFRDGKPVADHERIWAWHQTLTDPERLEAAKVLRRTRVGALRPVRDTVEPREYRTEADPSQPDIPAPRRGLPEC